MPGAMPEATLLPSASGVTGNMIDDEAMLKTLNDAGL